MNVYEIEKYDLNNIGVLRATVYCAEHNIFNR